MSIDEIIGAIAALPDRERERFYARLSERMERDPAAPRRPEPSAHDRARGLIGAGSGLGDLSSNPAYLEGFGEAPR